jgi:hypothetical protein
MPVWCEVDVEETLVGIYQSQDGAHIWTIAPQGDWALPTIEVWTQQMIFQEARADRLCVTITPAPGFFAYDAEDATGAAQFSSWSITGVKRFFNCDPCRLRPTWGEVEIILSTAAGVHTLSLYNEAGDLLAQGSRTGDGSITLAEQNDSGISGSVTLTYSGDITENVYLIARFPASYQIHYKSTGAFVGGDFPRTAEATKNDDGRAEEFTWRSAALAAGTYHVLIRAVDENGNVSTNVGGDPVTVYAPPAAPGAPAYSSGNSTNTVISFAASATSGATYNIYDSMATAELKDLETPDYTHIAGTGTLTQALAALAANYTGMRYVIVRAVKSGVEEANMQTLALEYAAGVYVPPRPPRPKPSGLVTSAGLVLTVPVTINRLNEKVAPALLQLFLASGGEEADFNFAAPDGSVAVASASGKIANQSISATGTAGARWFCVRTKSAGLALSDDPEIFGPVYLTAVVPAAPAYDGRGGF